MGSTENNAEQIDRLRFGDPATWNELRSTLRRAVLPRIVIARSLDREEILTDVTTTLWLSLDSLRDGSKLLAFAATIARRVVARKIERLGRHLPLVTEPPARSDGSESGQLEYMEFLESVAASLKAADWTLFKLLYLNGASNEEVQRILSVSPRMLRQRKHRLHRRIQGQSRPIPPRDDTPT
jgi:DNA-directed RNA polymerase specialized sigma24 family protein